VARSTPPPDSEGEEGRFFIWTREQVDSAVGSNLAPFARAAYGLEDPPNFEGREWVLRRDLSVAELAARFELAEAQTRARLGDVRGRLLESRASRVPPLRDDKQLVGWNGLMISAFADAGLALGDPDLIARAARAADALLSVPRAGPGARLPRYLKDGKPHGSAVLEDYAFLIAGLIDLFEADGNVRWLDAALALQAEQDALLFDELSGGYWIVPADGDVPLAREKPSRDGAVPSGNSIAAMNLVRLYHLTGDARHSERAEMTFRAFSDLAAREPTSQPGLLEALDFELGEPREIVIVTPGQDARREAAPFLRELARSYLPDRVLVVVAQSDVDELGRRLPVVAGRKAIGGATTAYVCRNRVCEAPVREPAELAAQLAAAAARPDPPATP
jgi:uncharacterized protein YyaL (SSP411 family)